ncbi:hypothetical protein [Deinococcus sp.]|uniref:hypothetical protein n=1 Tax=Deinococcus sp. TaxID=47478 RepID=UPI003C7CCBA2
MRVPRMLLALALCAPLALVFGLAGAALPLVVWLAHRGQNDPRGAAGGRSPARRAPRP